MFTILLVRSGISVTANARRLVVASGSSVTVGSISYGVLLPTMLFINFGVFQYLVLLFRRRARREPFVLLLLVIAVVGCVVLMGFSVLSEPTREEMARVSNFCLALVLLVQTAHLDAGIAAAKSGDGLLQAERSSRSRLLVRLAMVLADLLILYDASVVAVSLAHLLRPSVASTHVAHVVDQVAENLTLTFTFALRFGLLARRKGWRAMLRDDALEVLCHVALVAQEYPFLMLVASDNEVSSDTDIDSRGCHGVPWLYVQNLCLRVILLPCVWMTIGEHHYHYNLLHLYESPTTACLSQLPDHALHELIRTASLVVASKSERLSSVSTSLTASGHLLAVVVPVAPIDEALRDGETSDSTADTVIFTARGRHPFEVVDEGRRDHDGEPEEVAPGQRPVPLRKASSHWD